MQDCFFLIAVGLEIADSPEVLRRCCFGHVVLVASQENYIDPECNRHTCLLNQADEIN